MKRGPVTGAQADRCAVCNHMRRFHRANAAKGGDVYNTCGACSAPDTYWHEFKDKAARLPEEG